MKFSLWHTICAEDSLAAHTKKHLSLNFKLLAWKLYFKWSPLHSLMTIQYSLIINNRHSWVHNFHFSKLLNNCCSHSFTICHLTVFVCLSDFFFVSLARSSAQFSINFFPELFLFHSKIIILVWRIQNRRQIEHINVRPIQSERMSGTHTPRIYL